MTTPINTSKAHLGGRATYEVPDRRWPVVTRTMLAKASELGEPGPDDNPLVKSLLSGYVYLCNVETNLKRALALAKTKADDKLAARIGNELERLEQVKEEWPLEIVG